MTSKWGWTKTSTFGDLPTPIAGNIIFLANLCKICPHFFPVKCPGLDFQRMEQKIHCIKEFLGVIPGFVKNTGFNENPTKIRMFLMLKRRIYENSTSLQCEEAEPINSSSLHPMLISVELWLVFWNLQTDRYPWTLSIFFLQKARSLCETSMSPTSAVHQTSSEKNWGGKVWT